MLRHGCDYSVLHSDSKNLCLTRCVYLWVCFAFLRRTASGTNTGFIREQPPSGQRVQFSGVTLVRFNAAGQIQQSIVFRCALVACVGSVTDRSSLILCSTGSVWAQQQ